MSRDTWIGIGITGIFLGVMLLALYPHANSVEMDKIPAGHVEQLQDQLRDYKAHIQALEELHRQQVARLQALEERIQFLEDEVATCVMGTDSHK